MSRCENLAVAGADKTGRALVNGGSEGSMKKKKILHSGSLT